MAKQKLSSFELFESQANDVGDWFGFVTDTHYDYKYESRKDNTLETLLNKTKQCYKWFKRQGCKFVIHGGDVFDRHRIYNFDLMRGVRNVLKNSGLKTYFILGQHDAQGYNRATLDKSNLGFIADISDGVLEFIQDEIEVGNYCFVASHVDMDVVKRVNSVEKHNKPVVCVCHALLTDQREAFGTISIGHIKNKNVQLVLSGDLHDGVPFQEKNNIQFYNPGALARTEKGMRMPKVGMLRWNNGKFELREFQPNCPKCEDIFFWDEKPKTQEVKREVDATSFIDEFRQFHSDAKDAYDLLLKIGKATNVGDDVLELISKYRTKKSE